MPATCSDLLSRHLRLAHADLTGGSSHGHPREPERDGLTTVGSSQTAFPQISPLGFVGSESSIYPTRSEQQSRPARQRTASQTPAQLLPHQNQSCSGDTIPQLPDGRDSVVPYSSIVSNVHFDAFPSTTVIVDLGTMDSHSAMIYTQLKPAHIQSQTLLQGSTANLSLPVEPAWDMAVGDDLDLLWDDFESSASCGVPPLFGSNYPINFRPLMQNAFAEFDPQHRLNHVGGDRGNSAAICRDDTSSEECNDIGEHTIQDDSGVMSRHGSRLPSLPPGEGARQVLDPSTRDELTARPRAPSQNASLPCQSASLPWHISTNDYHLMTGIMQDRADVLPSDFIFPSRHALCRYVEGYFTGFHEHLPFMHLPTASLVTRAPELLLAVAAAGARYRFQPKVAQQLYLAARCLLEHQLRHRDPFETNAPAFDTPGSLAHNNSYDPLPALIRDDSAGNAHPRQVSLESRERDMETMQAMIVLVAMGTWNHKSFLKDALSIASQLAMMVREDCRLFSESDTTVLTWREWVSVEGRRRTNIVATSFFNLHSIAFHRPPKLHHSEIGRLNLPCPETWWRAHDEAAWEVACSKDVYHGITLQASYVNMFSPTGTTSQTWPSSFGNYLLIHCIVQQIYFSRQSPLGLPSADPVTLPPDTLLQLDMALRRWQENWEATKDSSIEPSAPGGPLSFNSTALLRIAYIRLSADLGPCRRLESQDPTSIAQGFRNMLLLERTCYVRRAVLQSAHSPSIPIRTGIEYVARTQALTWSIVHSLCNLECGLFLAKWLETIASVLERGETLRKDEKRLLGIVASIICETDLGAEIQREQDALRRIKLMAISVLRIWGYTFKGAHVWDIMGTIGTSLDLCADMLQREANLGGMSL
ncbi:transcription factor STE12 [Fusarium circinatum]|uniref:Transcription factor STE12 n=1 Tax=Fusarium circinatum TaxID=48490 RepID=A0A8H5X596_FUSCI|nr:transcription factor STE12 [Fusarium circinatum]